MVICPMSPGWPKTRSWSKKRLDDPGNDAFGWGDFWVVGSSASGETGGCWSLEDGGETGGCW